MDRIVVYVNKETKHAVKDIIDNPHSPYKTYADFYRKAIWNLIQNNTEYVTNILRPTISTIPYEKPMTTGDIVDVFLDSTKMHSLNARIICGAMGVNYGDRKKRFHSRMKELIQLGVIFKDGLHPTKIETTTGVRQTRQMNYYALNYSNKYVKSRIKQRKDILVVDI